GVKSPAVVEDLDVLLQRSTRPCERPPSCVMHELLLERAEETLDDRVVPAIAATTHARLDAMAFEQLAVRVARVLTALVGVMQDAWSGLTPSKCHLERCLDEIRVLLTVECPTDHHARVQVDHHRQEDMP